MIVRHSTLILLVLFINSRLFSQPIADRNYHSFGIGLYSYNIIDDDLAIFPSEHKKIYPAIEFNYTKYLGTSSSFFFPYYNLSIGLSSTDRGIYTAWPVQSTVWSLQGYLGFGYSPLASGILLFNIAVGMNYLYMAGKDDLELTVTAPQILYRFPSSKWENYWNSLPKYQGTEYIKGFPSFSRTAFALDIGTRLQITKGFGVYFEYTPVFSISIRHDCKFGICLIGN